STIKGRMLFLRCFINTSANYIAVKIPHFSTIGQAVLGQAYSASGGSSGSSSSSGGGGGGISSNATLGWKTTFDESGKELSDLGMINYRLGEKERVKISLGGAEHYVGVIKLNSTSITINVSSTPQQAVLNIGESEKFEVNDDNYYDIKITLNSIAFAKANLTLSYLHELKPGAVEAEQDVTAPDSSLTNQTGTLAVPETTSTKNKSYLLWMLFAIIILVLIIAGSILFYWKEKGKIKYLKERVKVKSP
ncbi:MAG: hypothetical protein AABX65_03890, partial [Nanoarchaeota archaeon]